MAKIAPMGMVIAECANFVSGACLFRQALGTTKCLVNDKRRCGYFESSVAPWSQREEKYLGAVEAYVKMTKGQGLAKRGSASTPQNRQEGP